MNSRELVYRTLEFNKPGRIPRQLWLLPWAQQRYPEMVNALRTDFPDDIVKAPPCYCEEVVTYGDAYSPGRYIDEWGCEFENRQAGIIGEVKQPLIADWGDIVNVKPPEALLSLDVDHVNAFCRQTDRFVLTECVPRPFERIQFLRGTENLMIDLALNESQVRDLISIVHDFYCRQIELWVQTEVDAIYFMDDWGSQQSLLISPVMWRKLFKPLYEDYINIAHSRGKKVFMHSDGYIIPILDDLIELGLDAINSQIFCIGIEELSQKYKGRITFWGEIDRQHLLAEGSEKDIVVAVQSVKELLYQDGGVIGQCEFGPGAKPENVYAVFQHWNRLSDINTKA